MLFASLGHHGGYSLVPGMAPLLAGCLRGGQGSTRPHGPRRVRLRSNGDGVDDDEDDGDNDDHGEDDDDNHTAHPERTMRTMMTTMTVMTVTMTTVITVMRKGEDQKR